MKIKTAVKFASKCSEFPEIGHPNDTSGNLLMQPLLEQKRLREWEIKTTKNAASTRSHAQLFGGGSADLRMRFWRDEAARGHHNFAPNKASLGYQLGLIIQHLPAQNPSSVTLLHTCKFTILRRVIRTHK